MRPGERVALVGENGAGKTTLTKLIARLYDPSEGRILLDGIDLREYDFADVRRAIGVIFQDFVRYDMRFDENVGVGEVEKVRDYLDAESTPDVDGAPTPAPITGGGREVACSVAVAAADRGVSPDAGPAIREGSICRAASGRRSRSPAPTCAMRNC